MKPLPLLAAVLLVPLCVPFARADSAPPSVGGPEIPAPLPRVRALAAPGAAAETAKKSSPPSADADTVAMLAKIGWKAIDDDALVRLSGPDKGYIPGNYLEAADIEWKDGHLGFAGGDAVDAKLLPRILDGLWVFVSAGKTPPDEAGKALAAWGLPPVVDGRKLVDPDGSATYYGQMLRLLYAEKPDALKRAGVERLSQAIGLLHDAHDQAFSHQAADAAKNDIDTAKMMLFAPARPGETPFAVKPYEDVGSQIEGFKSKLAADRDAAAKLGDADRAKDSAAALDVLNTLERQRYHSGIGLPSVPKPGQRAEEKSGDDADPDLVPVNAPLSSGLPLVLRALDRVNGKPLTPAQQENLIKSFPMGDLVWRLGVQDLWRQGLTGQGVKVAVIDGGIGRHDELDSAVKSRTNFTADRGKALTDDHGTHVAGIIHALAPDAEIRGYTVFTGDGANPRLKEDGDGGIVKAIDRAVKDGNRIINMSLGGGGSPSDEVARKVEQYAKQGVIFVVATGNEHDKNSVESPSVAPNAISVGALDSAGRAADFSSYGSNFDARKIKRVVKTVFMAPGTNIYSTVVGPNGSSGYELMDGTSMATPATSGVTALLSQAAAAMTPNPLTLSGRVRDALAEGSTPMSLDKLPSNVPFDQTFLVVKPLAALDAMRRKAAEATAGNQKKSADRTN
jgi:subtilisin family serine protease